MRDQHQASKPSRRSIVASPAAGIAAAVPAKAIAATGDHPDRELLEMGRRYAELEELEKAADDHHTRCQAAYQELEPDPPDALRHRIEDHAILGLPILDTWRRGLSCDVEDNDLYSEAEIESLPRTPKARAWNIQTQQARIAEIESAWKSWDAKCCELAEELGVWEALDEIDEIVAEHDAATDELMYRSIVRDLLAMTA